MNPGYATDHPSFDVEPLYEPSAPQSDLWKNTDPAKVGVYRLPKHLDEEVARLHLEQIGLKLTKLTKK